MHWTSCVPLEMMYPTFFEITSYCNVDEKMSTPITQQKRQTFSSDLKLQSWTKVLGQIYICGAFHTRQTNSSTLAQPLPPPPPPYNVGHVYTLFHQSFNIVLGGGGGGGREKQRILKRITVFLLRLRSKNTKNECNYTSVPRNFVHHCLIFTSHSKMHNNRVFWL